MYRVLIESPTLGVPHELIRLHGAEGLGELFEYRAEIALSDPGVLRGREAALLGDPIRLVFEEGGAVISEVHGIASQVQVRVAPNQRTGSAEITLVPRAFTMT